MGESQGESLSEVRNESGRQSLWSVRADELLARTTSADPTPGGGSIAAVTGALGVGLMQMALAVTGDPARAEHVARRWR